MCHVDCSIAPRLMHLLDYPTHPPHTLLASAPARLQRTRQAMTIVGIPEAEQDAVFRAVAAVLHLGNVAFVEAGDSEASQVRAAHAVCTALCYDGVGRGGGGVAGAENGGPGGPCKSAARVGPCCACC